MPKRRTYPWPQLLAQFERSGLSQTEFCKQHDINPKYFSLMRSKHQVVDNDRAFAKVVVPPESSRELSTLPGLVVELGHCKIHCPPNLPIASLAALVKACA